MYRWDVEDHRLMGVADLDGIGLRAEVRNTSREDKIAFLDSRCDNKLTYLLQLIRKFEAEEHELPKDSSGRTRKVSIQAWLRRNDLERIVDIQTCRFTLLNINRAIMFSNCRHEGDLFSDLVDCMFLKQLMSCLEAERLHFQANDPVMSRYRKIRKYHDRFRTTFGLPLVFSSDGKVHLAVYGRDRRYLNLSELDKIILSYERLEEFLQSYKRLEDFLKELDLSEDIK